MGLEMESPFIPIPLQSHKYLYHHRHSWLLKKIILTLLITNLV